MGERSDICVALINHRHMVTDAGWELCMDGRKGAEENLEPFSPLGRRKAIRNAACSQGTLWRRLGAMLAHFFQPPVSFPLLRLFVPLLLAVRPVCLFRLCAPKPIPSISFFCFLCWPSATDQQQQQQEEDDEEKKQCVWAEDQPNTSFCTFWYSSPTSPPVKMI